MAADNTHERCLEACATYQRDIALAQIDTSPGEEREARLAEAVERGAEVCSASEIEALGSIITAEPSASQETLRRLRAWGLDIQMRAAVLPRQREVQARQRTMICVVDEEPISLPASFTAMALEKRRDRRMAIEEATGEQLEALDELIEAQYEEFRRVAALLGYASPDAMWADIAPVEIAAQEDFAVRLLEETHEVYSDLLTWAVKQRLRVPPGQLRRHDIFALFTFPEYQQYYQPGVLIPSLQTCLQDMGIDPRADGRLVLRKRPVEFGPPAAFALQIPDEIVLSYSHASGLKGAEAYADAYGQALLWAYTSPALSLTQRLLGDTAIPTSSGQFLAEMIALPGWLRQYLQVSIDGNYWPWRRLDRLYRLRRQLGRFLYARHLYTNDSLAGAQEAYREIMMDACQVNYHPAYYLVDWDWQYTSLAFFRGWGLAYVLLDAVREQFASDWFRSPDCGTWLRDYWRRALGEKVDDLMSGLAGIPWDATWFAEMLADESI